jgi:hypothetical protein
LVSLVGLLIGIHIRLSLFIRVHSCPFAVAFVVFAPFCGYSVFFVPLSSYVRLI